MELKKNLRLTRTQIHSANKGDALSYIASVVHASNDAVKMPSTKTGVTALKAQMRSINSF